jgi:hypothetical protein
MVSVGLPRGFHIATAARPDRGHPNETPGGLLATGGQEGVVACQVSGGRCLHRFQEPTESSPSIPASRLNPLRDRLPVMGNIKVRLIFGLKILMGFGS